jgi:transposase
MTLYCGIDLHSNNHVVVVIDDNDKRLYERRIPNDLAVTLEVLQPFKADLEAVAVESTFNWYWLVDGLQDAGFNLKLVNTAAVKQYEGMKYRDDRHDAFWLAHLMRLGILPTGYIYPKAQRAVRDLLRRRMQLVRIAAGRMISIQSHIWRSTGCRLSANQVRKPDFMLPLPEGYVHQAAQSLLNVQRAVQHEIDTLERTVLAVAKVAPDFQILQSVTGIGPILGMTIWLETGDIRRFNGPGNYASYSRCVKSEHTSNGKKKGEGNRKAGNKYLSWAFSEAAHFAVRFDAQARRFFERKRAKTCGIVAIRAVAHKLARACYCMLRDQSPYDATRAFG